MRKRPISVVVTGFLLAFLAAGQSVAQQAAPSQAPAQEKLVGKALYEKLQRDGRRMMGPPGGAGGFAWTLDGKGSYAFEDGTFKRTDLATCEKTPLFDDAKIIAAIERHDGPPGGQAALQPVPVPRRRQGDPVPGLQQDLHLRPGRRKARLLRARALHHRRPGPRLRRRPLPGPQAPGLHPELQPLRQGPGRQGDGPDRGRDRGPAQRLPRLGLPRGAGPVRGLLVVPRLEIHRLHAVRREAGDEIPDRPRRPAHPALRASRLSQARRQQPHRPAVRRRRRLEEDRPPRDGRRPRRLPLPGQVDERRAGVHLPPPQPVPEQGRALRRRSRHGEDAAPARRHRSLLHRRVDRPVVPRGRPALPLDLGAERLARDLSLRHGGQAPQASHQRQAARERHPGRRRSPGLGLLRRLGGQRHGEPRLQGQARRHGFRETDQGARHPPGLPLPHLRLLDRFVPELRPARQDDALRLGRQSGQGPERNGPFEGIPRLRAHQARALPVQVGRRQVRPRRDPLLPGPLRPGREIPVDPLDLRRARAPRAS